MDDKYYFYKILLYNRIVLMVLKIGFVIWKRTCDLVKLKENYLNFVNANCCKVYFVKSTAFCKYWIFTSSDTVMWSWNEQVLYRCVQEMLMDRIFFFCTIYKLFSSFYLMFGCCGTFWHIIFRVYAGHIFIFAWMYTSHTINLHLTDRGAWPGSPSSQHYQP